MMDHRWGCVYQPVYICPSNQSVHVCLSMSQPRQQKPNGDRKCVLSEAVYERLGQSQAEVGRPIARAAFRFFASFFLFLFLTGKRTRTLLCIFITDITFLLACNRIDADTQTLTPKCHEMMSWNGSELPLQLEIRCCVSES